MLIHSKLKKLSILICNKNLFSNNIYSVLQSRDTKKTFHAKTGTIKDRKAMDLTEAEDIKKMWHEYTEELYKKDLHEPENHYAVITQLKPHPGKQSQAGMGKHHC